MLGQPEIENTEIIVKVVIVYRKIERAVQRNTEIVILYDGARFAEVFVFRLHHRNDRKISFVASVSVPVVVGEKIFQPCRIRC